MDLTMIDLTPVQQALVALLASWVTICVIPWLKAKTNRQQQAYVAATARMLVYAAEQLFGAGQGAAKLQYVERELAKRGLKADTAVIEAAVRGMNLIENWETTITLEGEDDGGEE